MSVMAGAHKGPDRPIRNLGVWRPIDDCPNDEKTYVLVVSEGSTAGVNIMRSDITRPHNVKWWTPVPALPKGY